MGDLIEYTQLGYKHANNGYQYILILIDCFTKMAYGVPLKNKTGFATTRAMEKILNDLDLYPNTLITDQGLEFYNKSFQSLLKEFGIHHYSIKSKMKASIVERLIRTLKMRIERYLYDRNTKRWISYLPHLINNYNGTPHRTIGLPPDQVTEQNREQVFKRMFPNINVRIRPRLSVGDRVRIVRDKTIFSKGYSRNWSKEVYKITEVKQRSGVEWYKVSTLDDHLLPKIKYYWELNVVSKNVNNSADQQTNE